MNPMLPAWAMQMNMLGAKRIPFLFIVDFEMLGPLVIPLGEISDECIRFNISSGIQRNAENGGDKLKMTISPVAFERYNDDFDKVLKAILAGDTYLLNLCYATRLSDVPSLEFIFENAIAPFRLLFQDRFVVFSPERFVYIEDQYIRTFPMKGTIDASIANAADLLLADLKEQEEHATVVDLLRNDLSIVSTTVTVERYRYISEVHTSGKKLLQCSSEISGLLPDDYLDKLGDIFYALLPAGSVTGAPKKKTVDLIKTIEPEPRGHYTGVFGVFDGKMLDSAVMIRMIEKRSDGYYYRSGGGITYRSDARQEYQEMIDKVYIPV